jgi:hypothetical protein
MGPLQRRRRSTLFLSPFRLKALGPRLLWEASIGIFSRLLFVSGPFGVRGHEKVRTYGHERSALMATKVRSFGHQKSAPLTEAST